jgi:long-chain acyl-CoA synthetase
MTWAEYFEGVEQMAFGMRSLGVKPGDRVAIYSNTRPEWALADMAILSIGAVVVPIYPSSIPEDIEFILNNSEAKLVFCENRILLDKINSIKNKTPKLENAVTFDTVQSTDKWQLTLAELKKRGTAEKAADLSWFTQTMQKPKLEELATIVYTSGTTGTPKGVMLTHDNIMSEVIDALNHLGVTEQDSSLTFLPFAHILARVEHFFHVYCGYMMSYAENIDRIRANLVDAKPTFIVAVPRIFEKIYNSMISQAEASPVKKKIFYWAMGIGREVSKAKLEKRSPSLQTLLQYQVAKRLVFDKLAQKLGGRLRFSLSGGAPLSKDIGEFFHAAGLVILEGYGLTETTAGVMANSLFDYRFGTVGKPIGDVQVKIANDGEILVKSRKNTPGYYKNEAATKEVLHDGWFATGDIGEFDADGFLKITDRKKDLIKTAGGKFIAPQKLENLLKLNKYVSNVLIHGDQRKYVTALITLNYDNIESYANDKGIKYASKAELAENKQVVGLMRDVVADTNHKLASYESIKNFSLLPNDFSIDAGELTPSLKVKRKFCDKKYKDTLDRLYGAE